MVVVVASDFKEVEEVGEGSMIIKMALVVRQVVVVVGMVDLEVVGMVAISNETGQTTVTMTEIPNACGGSKMTLPTVSFSLPIVVQVS